jgi:hypothetical protein
MATKIFLLMILLHVIDDFHLQGILANMKQKEWWRKQEGYNDLYKNDYKTALFIHSLSWAIIISLPFLWIQIPFGWASLFIVINTGIHYYVDDLKANKHKISLYTDQTIHFIQIFVTWLVLGYVI